MTKCLHCQVGELVEGAVDRGEISYPSAFLLLAETLADLVAANTSLEGRQQMIGTVEREFGVLVEQKYKERVVGGHA